MAANCEPRKIDSNGTGLAFAETICGRLPTLADDGYTPIWYELEPNEYEDFGGEITTMARTPINASRQRKKGVTVDLDAEGGFNTDWTQNNMTRLLQGFMFAEVRQKATTFPLNGEALDVTAATLATSAYDLAAGGSRFRVGQLVKVSGFVAAANNGLKLVSAVTDTSVVVGGALVDEAGSATVKIEAVGFELGAGLLGLTMLGNIPVLTYSGAAATKATGTLTLTGPGDELDTVTVGEIEYTLTATPTVGENEIPLGATADETATNIAAAINGDVVGMLAHPSVTAVAGAGVVTVTAVVGGAGGNLIALDTVSVDITAGGETLATGSGFSLLELGAIPGEWVFLGGDLGVNQLTAALTGFARIAAITDTTITLDKTTFAPVADAGAGKAVRIFTGLVLKNEKDPERIVTHYYEFERTLGKDADGIQSEYLTRAVANELSFNIPVADKLNVDLSYVGSDAEQRTGAEGRKEGSIVAALGEDAFNTSSNVVRMRMAVVDPTTTRPLPLFAYITEGTITINNSVEGVKAVANLGNIDVSVGDFEVGGELTALFSTVAATKAVRNNADVTLDFIAAAKNAGFVFDIPLLSLGGGRVEIEAGEPVTVPLETFGAENPLGYTMLYTNFPYLPTIATPKPGVEY